MRAAKSIGNGVAMDCQSVAMGCQFCANQWQCHWQWTATGNKINDLQVSCSKNHCHNRLSQQNKGFARVCSLLRYVWKKYEAGTADGPLLARSPQRSGRKRPEYGMALSAILPLTRPLFRGLTALLILGGALTQPALGEGWSTSRSFDAGEAERLREAHAARLGTGAPAEASASGWGTSAGPSSRLSNWVALDAFERSFPGKVRPSSRTFRLPSGSARDQLFALIAFAESPGAGYDAVHHAAKIQPPGLPSRLTLSEIAEWIDATPGQPHAIGRYQIIPSTLARLQDRLGLAGTVIFSPATQDRMADRLLADAGYHAFRSGKITRAAFMDRLAHIWAGLPLASGLSAHHGLAGNRATITRAFYEAQIARIFPGAQHAEKTRRSHARTDASNWRPLGQPAGPDASD